MRTWFAPFVLAVFAGLIWERGALVLAADPRDPVTELVSSEDLEGAFKALGFDFVHAYFWHGGLLQGKINFQDGPAIKPLDLDRQLFEMAKSMFREGETFDPKVLSGAIVVAIKKPESEVAKARTCQVSVVIRKHVIRDDGKGKKTVEERRLSRMFSGQVPKVGQVEAESRVSDFFETNEGKQFSLGATMTFEADDGKDFLLYSLNVSDKPPATGKSSKGDK